MRKLILDGSEINNKEELFASLKEQIASEDFIGNNLDALADVLGESSEPLEVELRNFGELKEHLGDYAQRLLKVLNDCSGEK